jgi:hypothetical protein
MNTSFDSRTSVTPKPMINISKHPRSQFRPNPACDTFCSQHYPSGRRLNRSAAGDHTAGANVDLGLPGTTLPPFNLATVLTSTAR